MVLNLSLLVASTQQKTIYPENVGDTWCNPHAVDTNYGSDPLIYSGYVYPSADRRAYIKFNLKTYDDFLGSTIQSATLKLYKRILDDSIFPFTLAIFRVTNDWDETKLNWNNQPGNTGSYVSTVIFSSNSDEYITFDVKSIVREWANDVANFKEKSPQIMRANLLFLFMVPKGGLVRQKDWRIRL